MGFYRYDFSMITNQNNNSLQLTSETFKDFVDAIIPRTPGLAEEYGEIQYYGALDLYTDEFLILSLNSYYIPMGKAMAEMLNIAAEELAFIELNEESLDFSGFPEGSTFAALALSDRLRAFTLLIQLELNYSDLLIPFEDYPGLISITSNLNRLTMMGYYSEWSGYGTTRLETPNQRILEYHPLSWSQVGYPGPSFSYRDLVEEYYMIRETRK